MTLKISPTRRIRAEFEGQTRQHSDELVLDEWTFVVAAFSYYKMPTLDSGRALCDLVVGTTMLENAISKDLYSSFPTFEVSDKIKIGGSPSFVGELSAINIYAGAFISPGINKIFLPIFF